MSNRFAAGYLKSLACLVALLTLSGTSMAQVYKCVGKDGKRRFGLHDRARMGNQRRRGLLGGTKNLQLAFCFLPGLGP